VVGTKEFQLAWRAHSAKADDHMPQEVADLLVRLFDDEGVDARAVDLGGGLVGVEMLGLPGTDPGWTHLVGVVEDEGWWTIAEHDALTDQPPVVLLGELKVADAVALVRDLAPRLEWAIPVDGSLTLDELLRLLPEGPIGS
jgi:hypothetical protein